jgi:replicative DNA helicase
MRLSNINSYITSNNKKRSFLLTGFNEGYSNLDLYLGGFELGNNIIIGARPSIGKTALAIELCKRFYKYNKDRDIIILFFNWEMGNEQIFYRLLCNYFKTDILTVKKNYYEYINTKDYKKFEEYINGLNIFFIESYNNIDHVANLVNTTREKYDNFDIICVYDHSRLVVSYEKNEEQRIFELLRTCNQFKKLGILNIVLSQLNREYEKNLDKRYSDPNNTYLFGADAIQQFSDVTLLLHNPYQYKCTEWECMDSNGNSSMIETRNKLFINISKNRNGLSNFNICLDYDKKSQTFSNIKDNTKQGNLFEDNNIEVKEDDLPF